MLYIAVSSSSGACGDILVRLQAPSPFSPLSLLIPLWVGCWALVKIRNNFVRASETIFMNVKAT